jgi:outer membrane protein assembly factor BamB
MNRNQCTLIVLITVCWGSAGFARASDWPRFRGPNGTGISSDKDVPIQWTESDILWKTPIPGLGNSSPIVWGNHVFIQSAETSGKERFLICLSANDGKILWNRAVPSSKAHTHTFNTWASSTPATDGQYVYAHFWDGSAVAIYAFDFHGNQIWKHDLGRFSSQHGPGASPIVHDGKVYFLYDQDKDFWLTPCSVVIALDAKTGKTAWEAQRWAFRACYSTPFILESPTHDSELIVATTGGITGYNPQSGKENWNWTWHFDRMPLRTVASPIFSNGLIFANSGDGGGDRHAVAVRPGERGESLPQSGSQAAEASLAWENKKILPYVPSLLAWQEYIFAVNDKGLALCNLAQTGKPVWDHNFAVGFSASPILIDGKIYAVSEDGEVFVFPAAPTYKQLAKNSIGEKVRATPAVANNRLFIRGQEHLYCIGKKGMPTE